MTDSSYSHYFKEPERYTGIFFQFLLNIFITVCSTILIFQNGGIYFYEELAIWRLNRKASNFVIWWTQFSLVRAMSFPSITILFISHPNKSEKPHN